MSWSLNQFHHESLRCNPKLNPRASVRHRGFSRTGHHRTHILQTLRIRNTDGGRASVEDLHRLNGVVVDPEGTPVPEAWVVMVGGPGWVAADEDGKFIVGPVRPGGGVGRCGLISQC